MKNYLIELMENTGNLTAQDIILHLVVAAVIGVVIYVSYAISHKGAIYSKKFNVSLIILTVLTATVMTVIGNNIALSLGMVGALSIVRFRTAIKDSRDTVYIFWTIIVGICCGVGDYLVAAVGSAVVFVLFLLLGSIKNDNRILLIVRGDRINEQKIDALMFQYFSHNINLRVKNSTEDKLECIYEITKKSLDKTNTKDKSITEAVYEIGNIDYFNIVTQNDDISS